MLYWNCGWFFEILCLGVLGWLNPQNHGANPPKKLVFKDFTSIHLDIATESGWWFGTCFIFHFIYGMLSFPLTFICFTMVKTTNQQCWNLTFQVFELYLDIAMQWMPRASPAPVFMQLGTLKGWQLWKPMGFDNSLVLSIPRIGSVGSPYWSHL